MGEHLDATRTHGGYHDSLVFPIPDDLKAKDAARVICAGLTIFSLLIQNGLGPGRKVDFIGIDGLVSTSPSLSRPISPYPFMASHLYILPLTINPMIVDN
jgi:D-arabinose 1-dehydrogenase-like Zn-dependent alcohol dehydrogenase